MAKKKQLLVETHRAGKSWSIMVSGAGEDIFQLFGSVVRNFASDTKLPIVNATDPFPMTKERKKKAVKALQDLKTAVIKS
jgi:hypothetical protein